MPVRPHAEVVLKMRAQPKHAKANNHRTAPAITRGDMRGLRYWLFQGRADASRSLAPRIKIAIRAATATLFHLTGVNRAGELRKTFKDSSCCTLGRHTRFGYGRKQLVGLSPC